MSALKLLAHENTKHSGCDFSESTIDSAGNTSRSTYHFFSIEDFAQGKFKSGLLFQTRAAEYFSPKRCWSNIFGLLFSLALLSYIFPAVWNWLENKNDLLLVYGLRGAILLGYLLIPIALVAASEQVLWPRHWVILKTKESIVKAPSVASFECFVSSDEKKKITHSTYNCLIPKHSEVAAGLEVRDALPISRAAMKIASFGGKLIYWALCASFIGFLVYAACGILAAASTTTILLLIIIFLLITKK